MNISTRIELYKELERRRNHPLVVYMTSSRGNAQGMMASDSLSELIEQIERLPPRTNEIDLLIESSGGDGLVAWRAISLLRNRIKKLNVLIPYEAFSAATILALGGDKIVMGKYACLGPIDPQITINKQDGTTEGFAYEDVLSFLDFVETEVGLTEQDSKREAFKMLCETINPPALGIAKRASSLSVGISEKLLLTHMTKNADSKTKAKDIATKLNKSFFSHGHALYRNEAREVGLNILDASKEEEELMWKIHKSFEIETESKNRFDPLAEFLSDPKASSFLSLPPPSINIPPQINQNALNQLMVQHIQSQLQTTGPVITRDRKHAFVESSRFASEFFSKIQILVNRELNLKFNVSVVTLKSGWRTVNLPPTLTSPN